MKKTILVLGAGSSENYGFPLTEELRLNMISLAEGMTNIEELGVYSISRENVIKFTEAFKKAAWNIDEFLNARPAFLDIGKILIAKALARYEKPVEIIKTKKEKDWYRFLIDELLEVDSNFKLKPITILTFNYDRSLEFYLFTTLQSRFGFNDEECKSQLSRLKIYHLYGSLGLLPWQCYSSEDLERKVGYGKVDSSYDNILIASRSIRLINERNDDSIWDRLEDIYTNTERIFFLGFGYNEFNLRNLRLEACPSNVIFAGTAKGVYKKEIEKITHLSKSKLTARNLKDAFIIEFFKKHYALEEF